MTPDIETEAPTIHVAHTITITLIVFTLYPMYCALLSPNESTFKLFACMKITIMGTIVKINNKIRESLFAEPKLPSVQNVRSRN
ncbi:hypothetical protein D3C80_1296760 [compost metagenome]